MLGLIAVTAYLFMIGPSMSGRPAIDKFVYLFISPIAVFIFSPLLFAVWKLGRVGSMGGNKR